VNAIVLRTFKASWPLVFVRIVGFIFLYAAFSKAADYSALVKVLKYDGFGPSLIEKLIAIIIIVECGLGLALALGVCLRRVLPVTIAVLGVFGFQLLYLTIGEGSPKCGCPGILVEFRSNRLDSFAGLIRNLILVGMLAFCWRLIQRRELEMKKLAGASGLDRVSERAEA
jgi:hypothetical protein